MPSNPSAPGPGQPESGHTPEATAASPGKVSDASFGGITRPSGGAARRGSYAVAAVAFAAGLLFATNASLFSTGDQRHPQNLVELARAETARLEEQEEINSALRGEIDAMLAEQPRAPGSNPQMSQVAHSVGLEAVQGPGLEVQLWDAPVPADGLESGLHPDDFVVHQQDLEAVMNALWAGGAEAMTIQDQRITSTSGVRCVGNVLRLHGRIYSPPYVVRAIGDVDRLEEALADSPGVTVYQQYVDAVGLGWSTARLDTIEMPPYTGGTTLHHAQVIDEAPSSRQQLEPYGRSPDDA